MLDPPLKATPSHSAGPAPSLTIYNAHTGAPLATNPFVHPSLSDLREFIAAELGTDPDALLLLTPQGARPRAALFAHCAELFAYDRSAAPQPQKEATIRPVGSPLASLHPTDARGLVAALTRSASWTSAAAADAASTERAVRARVRDITCVFRALSALEKHLAANYADLDRRRAQAAAVLTDTETTTLRELWELYYVRLEKISLFNDKASLATLLPYETLAERAKEAAAQNESATRSARIVDELLAHCALKIAKMERKLEQFRKNSVIRNFGSAGIDEMVEHVRTQAQTMQRETQQQLARLPQNDVSNVPSEDVKGLAAVVAKHRADAEPLLQSANDLYYLEVNLGALHTKLGSTMSEALEKTGAIQDALSDTKNKLKELLEHVDKLQLAESKVFIAADLPLLYGLFLLENVRRIEWQAEIGRIAGNTAESFALANERELRYRQKWIKNYGSVLGLLGMEEVFPVSNLAVVEISTRKDDAVKVLEMCIERRDVEQYVESLRTAGASEAASVLESALILLKNQKNALDARFEGGFVAGKGSTLDEELIKSYQARIKKLEALLHQSKFKQAHQWPLLPVSRSRSPVDKTNVSPKLSIAAQRSLLTTLIHRISTVVTGEKKKEKRLSFGRMFGPRPRKSLLLGNGNIELTNSVLLLEEEKKDPVSGEIDTEHVRVSASEWDGVKNENNALNVENHELRDLVERLNGENGELGGELEGVESKYREALNKVRILEEEAREAGSLRNRILELERENRLLSGKVKEAVDSKDSAESDKVRLLEFTIKEKDKQLTEKQKAIDILEKEAIGYKETIANQQETLSGHSKTIESQKSEISRYKTCILDQTKAISENQSKVANLEVQVALLKEELEFQKSEVVRVQQLYNDNEELERYEELLRSRNKENSELGEKVRLLESDLRDTESVKKDLLANMHSKEAEFATERKGLQDQIKSLSTKIEELEDAEEELECLNKELSEKNVILTNSLGQLGDVVKNIRKKAGDLSELLVRDLQLVCACFEAVGLVMTSSDSKNDGAHEFFRLEDGSIVVYRVKGLRGKKRGQTEPSVLVSAARNLLGWEGKSELEDSKSFESILKIEAESKGLADTYNGNKAFEDAFFSFILKAALDYNLVLGAISKRFGDIEHLAKKLQKESKSLKEDVARLSSEASSKIAVKDFKPGDLVLFLPTREDDGEESELLPWAAFNIGAPHYYLKEGHDLEGREWMVCRVGTIEESGGVFLVEGTEDY